MLLNTSFNRHGISTISTPRQAVEHLMEGCMDVLYIGKFKIELKKNRLLSKKENNLKDEKDLLKQNNVKWLNQNKSEMKNSAIKKYINNLKRLK